MRSDPWSIVFLHRDSLRRYVLEMDGPTYCGFRTEDVPPVEIRIACLKAAEAARLPREQRTRWNGPSGEIGGTRWTWRIEEGV
jgi:hypothetical protein